MNRAQALAQLTAPGAPFELVPVAVYGRKCRGFRDIPATMRDLYSEARSELPFIVYEDECLSFDAAWRQAGRIGALLIDELGLEKGDRVAISMRNYPEWITAFMAATSVGCIAVAMNSLWGPDEMEYGLKDCGARVLFADQERLQRLAQCTDAPEYLVVLGVRCEDLCVAGARHFSEALAAVEDAEMPLVDMHPNDDVTILYTSGSTGHPKGAVSCH